MGDNEIVGVGTQPLGGALFDGAKRRSGRPQIEGQGLDEVVSMPIAAAWKICVGGHEPTTEPRWWHSVVRGVTEELPPTPRCPRASLGRDDDGEVATSRAMRSWTKRVYATELTT